MHFIKLPRMLRHNTGRKGRSAFTAVSIGRYVRQQDHQRAQITVPVPVRAACALAEKDGIDVEK